MVEAVELEALYKQIPDTAVSQLKAQVLHNALQNQIINELHPKFILPILVKGPNQNVTGTTTTPPTTTPPTTTPPTTTPPTTTPPTPPTTTPPTPTTVAPGSITVEAFWWGFHFVIPESVMAAWTTTGAAAGSFAVSVTAFISAVGGSATAAGPAAPYVAIAGAYVAAECAAMKALDQGHGVYLSMSWFAPGLFAPTPR